MRRLLRRNRRAHSRAIAIANVVDPLVAVSMTAVGISRSSLSRRATRSALRLSFNSQAASIPIIFISEQFTHAPIPIPIPDFSPINPPLGLIPPLPLKFDLLQGTAKQSPIEAAETGMAEASKAADAVTATGSLDVLRYGQILKARRLVGVRGSGPAFEGLYYVKSVTHKIKRGEFTQDFVLTRNGLLSTFPRVPA